MNPSQAFWDWFDGLPAPHREAVAQIVMTSLPDYPARNIVDPGKMVEDFRINFSFGNDLPSREVSKLLILRRLIDFFVVRRMRDKDQWEKDKCFWEYIVSEYPEHANEAESFLQQIPFQSAMWRKTCESWDEFCAKGLSDAALRRWMDDLHLRKFAGWGTRGAGENKPG
jgi:hypothetical protein